jgi:CDGSH-type Zn-finger protein
MSEAQILITENGPYVVSGMIPLTEQELALNADGNTWDFADTDTEAPQHSESYALCRCGQSGEKPFCDGTHARIGFDGSETASRRPFADDAELSVGPELDLADDRALCAFARICDGHGRIWNLVLETNDAEKRAIVAHQGSHCPSGRLVVTAHGAAQPIELAFDASIVLFFDWPHRAEVRRRV